MLREARFWCMLMCQDSKPRRCSFALPWSTVCHLARHKADSTEMVWDTFSSSFVAEIWFHLASFFWWICSHFWGSWGVGGQWRCHGHQPSLIPWRGRRVRLAVLQLRVSGLVERGKNVKNLRLRRQSVDDQAEERGTRKQLTIMIQPDFSQFVGVVWACRNCKDCGFEVWACFLASCP